MLVRAFGCGSAYELQGMHGPENCAGNPYPEQDEGLWCDESRHYLLCNAIRRSVEHGGQQKRSVNF